MDLRPGLSRKAKAFIAKVSFQSISGRYQKLATNDGRGENPLYQARFQSKGVTKDKRLLKPRLVDSRLL